MISDQLADQGHVGPEFGFVGHGRADIVDDREVGHRPRFRLQCGEHGPELLRRQGILGCGIRREFQIPNIRLLVPAGVVGDQFNPHSIDGNLVRLQGLFHQFLEAIYVVPDGLRDLIRLVSSFSFGTIDESVSRA